MPAHREALRSALRAYARYAVLVAEQLEALDQADRARFARLAEERERVRAELDALAEPLAAGPEGAGLDELMAEAVGELDRPTAIDDALLEQLTRLQGHVHGLGLRRFEWGSYAAAPPAPDAAPTVDIRY